MAMSDSGVFLLQQLNIPFIHVVCLDCRWTRASCTTRNIIKYLICLHVSVCLGIGVCVFFTFTLFHSKYVSYDRVYLSVMAVWFARCTQCPTTCIVARIQCTFCTKAYPFPLLVMCSYCKFSIVWINIIFGLSVFFRSLERDHFGRSIVRLMHLFSSSLEQQFNLNS